MQPSVVGRREGHAQSRSCGGRERRSDSVSGLSGRPKTDKDGQCGSDTAKRAVADSGLKPAGRVGRETTKSSRSGQGAIAPTALLAVSRQPIKKAPEGRYRSAVARQTLGGRERSERRKRSRGRGAPASPRGATEREEPRAPPQLGRERVARDGSRRPGN